MNINIVIIGAGQLGSRHLQALALIKMKANIYVVDPIDESLRISELRYKEVVSLNDKSNISNKVIYLKDINDLPKEIDVAVIATTSKVRLDVIKQLVSHRCIKYMILEKFLFPKMDEYLICQDLLVKNNITTFVNCARRMWPFYQKLKTEFMYSNQLTYHVCGANLGIGCNSIHFIDYLAWLSNCYDFKVDSSHLEQKIISSKRNGYIEFTGTLSANSNNGDLLTITSYENSDAPILIEIHSDNARCIINEKDGKALLSKKTNYWDWETIDFKTMYQSGLTHLAVEKLINTGTCDLVDYGSSMKLHQSILQSFLKHLEIVSGNKVSECLIT
jgi:hypothetical protein